jgi:hypothetical protein
MLFYLIYEVILKKFNITFLSDVIEKCNENNNENGKEQCKETKINLYTIYEDKDSYEDNDLNNIYKIV